MIAIGALMLLVSLEFFSQSIKKGGHEMDLKAFFLSLKKRLETKRVVDGVVQEKVKIQIGPSEKFAFSIMFAVFLLVVGISGRYMNGSTMDRDVSADTSAVFEEEFLKTYQASNFPPRASDVIYKYNFEAESHTVSSPDEIGTIVSDPMASGGAAMFAKLGEAERGRLAHTTINNVQPDGQYKVHFNLKIASDSPRDKVVAVIEVLDTQTNQFLAQQEISSNDFDRFGKYQNFELEFEKESTGNTQYRVLYTDEASLWLDKISVDPQFSKDLQVIYDPAIYFDNVSDPMAYASFAREATASRDLRGHMTKIKVDEELPAGSYTAVFRVKTFNNKLPDAIARIEVHDKGQRSQYYSQDLHGTSFSQPNQYHDFAVKFMVTKLSRIEFSAFFFDIPNSDLFIDTVTVVRDF